MLLLRFTFFESASKMKNVSLTDIANKKVSINGNTGLLEVKNIIKQTNGIIMSFEGIAVDNIVEEVKEYKIYRENRLIDDMCIFIHLKFDNKKGEYIYFDDDLNDAIKKLDEYSKILDFTASLVKKYKSEDNDNYIYISSRIDSTQRYILALYFILFIILALAMFYKLVLVN